MTSVMIDGKKINQKTVPDVRTETQKRYRVGKLFAYAQQLQSKASESAYKEFEQTIKGLRSTRDAALNAENERFVAESTRHSKEVVAIESRFITDPTLIAARKVLDAKVAATLEQFYQLCPEARGN